MMLLKYLFYSSRARRFSIIVNLLHHVSPADVMQLLLALGNKRFHFARIIMRALSLPIEPYRDLYSQLPKDERANIGRYEFSLVREYYLLSQVRLHFSKLATEQIAWGNFKNFSSMQHLPRLLCHASSDSLRTMKAWEDILQSVSANNQAKSIQHYNLLSERLVKLQANSSANVSDTIHRMDTHLSTYASVVLTFNSNVFDLNKNRLYKNFFQTHHRGEEGDTNILDYLQNRMLSEILLYTHARATQLLRFAMLPNEHPCYATLQLQHQIEPVQEYGNSFIVFDPCIKDKATALFGAPLTKILYKNVITLPTRLNESLVPLLMQLSDQLLISYAEARHPKDIPTYNKQFQEENSEYIEVQFPANINLYDGKLVKHIHIEFSRYMLKSDLLGHLQKDGVIVTIDKNPFQNQAYLKAFSEGCQKRFMTEVVADYIYQLALFVGETSEKYLQYSCDKDVMQFTFNVTNNYHGFHQAQAAGLLYVLGVRDYFKKNNSAINFSYEKFTYRIPLNNTKLNEGSIFDHDSYQYHFASLVKLLNKLLLRVLSTLVICQNNEDYVTQNKALHPVTGKGATEESLLLGEYYLMTDGETIGDDPAFKVNWLFDSILIEAVRPQPQGSMLFKKLSYALTTKIEIDDIHFNDSFMIIRLSLPELIKKLNDARFPYQANIIYEELNLDHYGDLLLAYRYGYTAPGGHNNDPYSWLGGFSDVEFGKTKFKNINLLKAKALLIGETLNPKTRYYFASTLWVSKIKEDEHEFVAGSLDRFSLPKLGQLSDEQVNKVAKIMNLSVAQYRFRFGSALPLRSLPAIYVYMDYYQGLAQFLLQELFSAICPEDKTGFYVKINARIVPLKIDGTYYDLPVKNFGKISINGKRKHIRILLEYLLRFNHFSESIMRDNTLILTNINPCYLLKVMFMHFVFHQHTSLRSQVMDYLLKKEYRHLLCLSPAELLDSFYEILGNKEAKIISLKEKLEELGAPFFKHILSGFMIYIKSLIENNRYDECAVRNDVLAKKYISVLRRWMLTRWGERNYTLYDFLHLVNEKNAIAFLQYNPFLHAVKRDPLSGDSLFSPDKEKWYKSLGIEVSPQFVRCNSKHVSRYSYDDLSRPRFFVRKHPVTYQALYAEKNEPGFLCRRASF